MAPDTTLQTTDTIIQTITVLASKYGNVISYGPQVTDIAANY